MTWKPFFIIGAARSGTTMLRRLLNRHSQLCVPAETHFIPEQYAPFVKCWTGGERQTAVDLLNSLALIKKWDVRVQIKDLEGLEGDEAYACAVATLMARRTAQAGKRYWGEKTPSYIFALPLLRLLFPEARFIHIYRDGRDVALSVMPLSWGPSNAYCAARWWQKAIEAWQAARPRLGQRTLEIRYEAFCRNPEEQLRTICGFIGIDYEENMLANYEVRQNNSGKWRNKFNMSSDELAAFEMVAGRTLATLGYKRGVADPDLPLWVRAFAIFDNNYKALSNRILRRDLTKPEHRR